MIETRDRGVFMFHGCYREKKRGKKGLFLSFSAVCGCDFFLITARVEQDMTEEDCLSATGGFYEALASC